MLEGDEYSVRLGDGGPRKGCDQRRIVLVRPGESRTETLRD